MKNPNPFRKVLTLLLVSGTLLTKSYAQDTHFSQFYEAPLLRNPSLAGIFNGDYRIQGVYRNQWNSITNAYKTGSFNGEYKMPVGRGDDFLTTGLQIVFDKAGDAGLQSTSIMPALNYHKSLSSTHTMYLSLGFMGGYSEKTIDRSKITTNSQFSGGAFNPSIPDGETFPTPNVHYWDGSVGMSFNSSFGADDHSSMYLGVAMHHLNRPMNNFYQNYLNAKTGLDPKYVVSGGIKFNLDERSDFTVHADYATQGGATEVIGGGLFEYKLGEFTDDPKYVLGLGAFMRYKDAVIPVVKMEMLPLSISISYDVNYSALSTVSQGHGGFELAISYIGFLDRDNSAKNKMLCPHF